MDTKAKTPCVALTLTVKEAAQRLGISHISAYGAVERGEIPAIRLGRRILVPVAALERMLDAAGSSKTEAA